MSLVEGYSSSDDESVPVLTLVHRYQKEMDQRAGDIGSKEVLNEGGSDSFDNANDKTDTEKNNNKKAVARKRKSNKKFDFDYSGPWKKQKQADDENEANTDEEVSNKDADDSDNNINDDEKNLPENLVEPATALELAPWSQFVGSKETDYLGRSFLHIPQDLPIKLTRDPSAHECFVPKKIVSTFGGHHGGVNKIDMFPISGHLFLSCGNDCLIKLWDFYHKHELLRVYHGHSLPVKDVVFDSTGKTFLSCGYDKLIRHWDTLSGNVLKTIKVGAIPNTIKFHPKESSQFIVGLSDKNILHYDLSVPDYTVPIQVYDHHQGSINSLTIIDDGNRFMLTSDDKSVRFWDWQINIPVKFISDPAQHSMPLAKVTPDGRFIALQSMDNTIHVIQGHGKYKFNRSKTFTGHNTAGYGIGIDISPDGKIIMSGDSKGSAFFWDWKTAKLVRKIRIDSKPISCISFHPQESSKVLVAGISGKIYCCD